LLVGAGALLVLLGMALLVRERFPGLRLGRLPGDIAVERGNFRFYFPLATSVLASIALSAIFWLCGRR
jgi:hypothetical protein